MQDTSRVWNSYLSNNIINRFPLILKCTIIGLIPVMLATILETRYNKIRFLIIQYGWLRTGSNPADINLFRSQTGKSLRTCYTNKHRNYFQIINIFLHLYNP